MLVLWAGDEFVLGVWAFRDHRSRVRNFLATTPFLNLVMWRIFALIPVVRDQALKPLSRSHSF